jgi:competence protein ComEA
MRTLPHEFTLSTPPPDPDELPSPSGGPANFHFMSYLLGLFTSLILVGGALFLLRHPDPPPIVLHSPPPPAPTVTAAPTPTPAPMMVFVSGAVQKPGLYNLPTDARVGDALAKAGGFTGTANASLINQAAKLQDGAQVHVPDLAEQATVQQPPAGVSEPLAQIASSGDTASNAQAGPINLNTATAEQLDSLPGIGPTKAEAIIANRPYATVDELDKVPGIGPSTLEQLRLLVTAQ